MNIILRPATNLMNRLTYLQKFVLISLICLVPLLALAYMQLNTLHKAKLVTEKELNGLTELRSTLSLVSLAAERRDLILVRSDNASVNVELDKRIQQKETDYIQLLKSVERKIVNNNNASTLSLIKKLTNDIQVDHRTEATRMTMAERFEVFNQTVSNTWGACSCYS